MAVDEKLRKDVLDTKTVRGIFEESDYYVVFAMIKLKGKWEYGRKIGKGKVSKVLASERMNTKKEKDMKGKYARN